MKLFGSLTKVYQIVFQTLNKQLTINPVTQTSADSTINIPDLAGGTHNLTTDLLTQTLKNKTLEDTTSTVANSTTATKQLSFDLSGATTATKTTFALSQTANRVITFPDDTATLATLAGVETLTNKTIGDALTVAHISSPSAPAAGYDKLYTKADDKLYKKTSAGVESLVGGGLTPVVPTVVANAFVAVDSTHALVNFSAASANITATLPTAVTGSSIAFTANGNHANLYRLILVPAAGQTITIQGVAYGSTDTVELLPSDDWCQLNWDDVAGTWRVDSNESFVSGTFAGDLVVTGALTPVGGIVGRSDGNIPSAGNVGYSTSVQGNSPVSNSIGWITQIQSGCASMGTFLVIATAQYNGIAGPSYMVSAINKTASSFSGCTEGYDKGTSLIDTGVGVGATVTLMRIMILAPTDYVYLNAQTNSATPSTAYGSLQLIQIV